jgi:tRNA-binding EMAP/Myf-like protein
MINIKEFSKIDIRVGTILKAKLLKGANIPAYHLTYPKIS